MKEKKFTILHLSDLHFGPKNKYNPERKKKYGEAWEGTLLEDLYKDLNDVLKKRPDCIIVSGDLTETADENQFGKCRLFLLDLCRKFDLDSRKDLVVIPGNHDIKWKNGFGDEKPYDNFFHELFSESSANEYFSMIRCFKGDIRVTVVGLNSCIIESKKTAGIGAIGPKQLDSIEKKMEELEAIGENSTKIAVLHHHLVPVRLVELIPKEEEQSFSLTHDSGYVLKWLIERGFSLVLHGHQHRRHAGAERRIYEDQVRFSNEIMIMGAGSIAFDPREMEEKTNSYNIIEIDQSQRMRIETRRCMDPDEGRGFKSKCVYMIPLDIQTAIADTLRNISERKNAYLSDVSSYSDVEKTVIHLLVALGAIRLEKGKPHVINDFDERTELGSNFIRSLLAHFELLPKDLTFFKGWSARLRSDTRYSIRQIISDCEKRRMRFVLERELPTSAIQKKYVLIVVAGKIVATKELCCLLRWHRDWSKPRHPSYLVPAHRPRPDVLTRFCDLDLAVEHRKLLPHLVVKDLEKFQVTKVSPRTGLLTKYLYEIKAVKIRKKGREIINSEAEREGRISFNRRKPESRERKFRWYTCEECRKDNYMMKVNEKEIEKVFEELRKLGDDFVSFEVD